MQTVLSQTVDPDAQCAWSIDHSLFQQLLTTDVPSFQNFMRMDVVACEDVLSCVEARHGCPQHQRSDWFERQKPQPISRRE